MLLCVPPVRLRPAARAPPPPPICPRDDCSGAVIGRWRFDASCSTAATAASCFSRMIRSARLLSGSGGSTVDTDLGSAVGPAPAPGPGPGPGTDRAVDGPPTLATSVASSPAALDLALARCGEVHGRSCCCTCAGRGAEGGTALPPPLCATAAAAAAAAAARGDDVVAIASWASCRWRSPGVIRLLGDGSGDGPVAAAAAAAPSAAATTSLACCTPASRLAAAARCCRALLWVSRGAW
jgi:hypothetical protein